MAGSNVIHEFKNQLGIILGFVELLLDDETLGDKRREDLQEIQKAAQRALTLVPSLGPGTP